MRARAARALPAYAVAVHVDEEIDRLYGLPLEEFVGERTAAVRAARKAGDREGADMLAKLRKPTLAAWAVNQLCRSRRRDVDLLLDAGHRLVAAQAESLAGGGRGPVERASRDLQEAIRTLREAAAEILPPRTSATILARVEESLRAAAIDPDGRELLARGRFERETTGTGWDVLAGLVPGTVPTPEAGSSRTARGRRAAKSERGGRPEAAREAAKRPDRTQLRKELERAREELREARERERETSRELRDAERELARAQDALAAATTRAEEARGRAADAKAEVERAEKALKALRRR